MVGPGISAWECWNFLAGEGSFSARCIFCKLLMGLMVRKVVLSRVSFTLVALLELSLFGQSLGEVGFQIMDVIGHATMGN